MSWAIVPTYKEREPRSSIVVRRGRECFEAYERLGTLQAVGAELGITKQRVQQLLARYEKLLGVRLPRQRADAIAKMQHAEEKAQRRVMGRVLFKRKVLDRIDRSYDELCAKIGRVATSTDLQWNHPEYKKTYLALVREYGGMRQYYAARGISRPIPAYWLRGKGLSNEAQPAQT